ncbi:MULTISPECIES: lysophospholipid acyltransferase family protein [Sphingomonas]|uniref:lysophospholipid acyltransferase family protein n=1 Tax=Sphingomonas TaxID=13687 RepID=UPI000DEEC9B7|nr:MULTISPECIES: lysophospholipid acyltransferase family protein [Sphingomonas]
MLGWLGVCVVAHLIVRSFGPSPWPRRLLRGISHLAGARVSIEGAPVAEHSLLIANHVSWLDIPMLAGATGCAFVAKDELQNHRVMRWLCEENGTVFVDRGDRNGIREQAATMRRALEKGRPLTLFPEGTVGDGGRLLPFRPALLSAFAPPPAHIPLRAVAIDYRGAAREFGWPDGETGVANFLRLLGRQGTVEVTLHLLAPLPPSADRKELARAAHDAIAATLAPSGIAPAAV